MDNKKLGIIGAVIVIIVIIICAFVFLGGNNNEPTIIVVDSNANSSASNISGSNSTGSINTSSSDASYQLLINTTGKWKLDLTVNGKYMADEGVGSKTIDLGNSLKEASVTVNQYENGPTNVYLLKNNEIIEQKSSHGEGIETIYFYYRA
ncbi:MAG: hypothetical protein IK044_05145 [Methanobrevibacter sp.]|nr:hypothetical protein [Methanobrevibacter sp.]